MMPSSSDLTYFVEVAVAQNLSRAAERLGITQPSLSLSIQRLEHQMGIALLVRSKRGVTLTPAGRKLYGRARTLIQEWDKLKSESLKTHNEVCGSYTLGCHPSVALFSLPQTLPKLLSQFPELEIRLTHNLSRNIVEDVISLRVDVGIVVNPVQHPDLVIRRLCKDEVTFWTSSTPSPNQSLESESGVLLCDSQMIQSQSLLQQMKRKKWRLPRVLTSSSLEVIAHLTHAGAGIGILPARVVAATGSKKLKRVPGAPVFDDEICLIYRNENRSIRAIQILSDLLAQGMAPASEA